MMSVGGEQFDAEAVDRSKERVVKSSNHSDAAARLENLVPRALLHFIGGAICVGDDDQLRERVHGMRTLRESNDAIGDGPCLARTRRCDDGKVSIEFGSKARARRLVDRLILHSLGGTNAG